MPTCCILLSFYYYYYYYYYYSACFNKAEELRLKQEELRNASFVKKEPFSEDITVKTECEETEEGEDSDSVDLDELSDWRFRTHN